MRGLGDFRAEARPSEIASTRSCESLSKAEGPSRMSALCRSIAASCTEFTGDTEAAFWAPFRRFKTGGHGSFALPLIAA